MTDKLVIPLLKTQPIDPTWLNANDKPLDILASFVRDTEHEIFAVVTALQAHIDLLYEEQLINNLPVARMEFLHRAVARIVQDTAALASVSELAKARLSTQSVVVCGLIQEIIEESQWILLQRRIKVTNSIEKNRTLTAAEEPLKLLFKAMLLSAIANCQNGDRIVMSCAVKQNLSIFSFNTGVEANEAVFEPWRLGELRLVCAHDQGIELAAIDAMARIQGGYLSVCAKLDKYIAYRLTFVNKSFPDPSS